jgi:hypothetical protein
MGRMGVYGGDSLRWPECDRAAVRRLRRLQSRRAGTGHVLSRSAAQWVAGVLAAIERRNRGHLSMGCESAVDYLAIRLHKLAARRA